MHCCITLQPVDARIGIQNNPHCVRRFKMHRPKFLGPVLGCVVLFEALALGQVTTGTIMGTISDTTGAIVPNTVVTLHNTETGFSRTATSDATGRYRAPELPLGNYEVTA